MEPKTKHTIKDRTPYLHLIPQSEVKTYVLKETGAKLNDTISFIKFVLPMVSYQTERLAKVIAGNTPFDYCKAVFDWVYDHIEYRRDIKGKEQIKSPQRTIFDGFGDCDDMQVLICSLLLNKKIPFKIRTTVYDEMVGVQHIYPFALVAGKEILMDCVAQKFNYEVPYIKKYDYELPYIKYDRKMELQFLNGTPEQRSGKTILNIDAEDLLEGLDEDEIGELGRGRFKAKIQNAVKKAAGSNVIKKVAASNVIKKVQGAATKVANSKALQKVKKAVHVVNRINPVAALLRTGILTALKMNMLKVAETLRFSYLTPQQAQAKGFDVSKISRLAAIRQRLEKIFFGAGGKIENFKASILTGKGNRDKQVAGLGYIDYNNYSQQNNLQQILGIETYNSETNEVAGFGELGVATEAALAAATGAMTAIAALIKGIGSLRKNKTAAQETTTAPATDNESYNPTGNDTVTEFDSKSNGGGDANQSTSAETSAATNKAEGSVNTQSNGSEGQTDSSGESADSSREGESSNRTAARSNVNPVTTTTQESVLDKAKKWVKENQLAAAGIAILVAGGLYLLLSRKEKDGKQQTKSEGAVSGLPNKKKSQHFHSRKVLIQKLR